MGEREGDAGVSCLWCARVMVRMCDFDRVLRGLMVRIHGGRKERKCWGFLVVNARVIVGDAF